jgi:hypothetical protein
MATLLSLDFNTGPFELPAAENLSVYSGSRKVTVAVTVEDRDGFPVVVFVPIPRDLIPELIDRLAAAL